MTIEEQVRLLFEAETRTKETIGQLAESIAHYVDGADARMKQSEVALEHLDAAVTRFIDSADTRMKIIERNLDALIRAIMAEHSNGKGKA